MHQPKTALIALFLAFVLFSGCQTQPAPQQLDIDTSPLQRFPVETMGRATMGDAFIDLSELSAKQSKEATADVAPSEQPPPQLKPLRESLLELGEQTEEE